MLSNRFRTDLLRTNNRHVSHFNQFRSISLSHSPFVSSFLPSLLHEGCRLFQAEDSTVHWQSGNERKSWKERRGRGPRLENGRSENERRLQTACLDNFAQFHYPTLLSSPVFISQNIFARLHSVCFLENSPPLSTHNCDAFKHIMTPTLVLHHHYFSQFR